MLAAAEREGLGLDLTIGPRWPATVSTVTDVNDPAVSKMLVFAHEFHPGGSSRSGPLPTNYDRTPPQDADTTLVAALVARCTTPGTSDSSPLPWLLVRSTVLDVTAEVTGEDALSVTFPGGENDTYALIVFRYAPTGQALSGFTPTGANYALDILSAAGTNAITGFYDTKILTPAVRDLLRRSGRSDLFEDSLELGETQKWTGDFTEEWTARRGYSPLTVLPALAGAGQHGMNTDSEQFFDFDDGSGSRVRHDYRQTHSDLYIARHLDGLRRWASIRSLRTRIQPYGAPIDTAEAASHIDVPEGETLAFGANTTDYSNIEDHKVVASGAHLSGVPVISSEACAFERTVWATTAGGDRTPTSALRAIYLGFAGGVTQVVWHGFPYLTAGPPGSGSQSRWPGMSYGGNTDFSEAWGPKGGPNWADYRFVNDALARVQLTMRQGVARFDCAVFRHDFGMNGTWTTGVGGDTLLRSTSELAAAGYTYEYLAPAHIMRKDATVSDRVLFRDSGGYRALILRKQSTMSVAAAKTVLSFARDGLPVLVVGDPPSQVPGFDPAGVLDKQLADVVSRLMAQPTTRSVNEDEDLPAALQAFSIEPAAAPIGGTGPLLSLRRHTPSVDYYLLINPTGVPVRQLMRLAGRGKPYLMDAWTGEITPASGARPGNGAAVVPVELGAGDITVVAVTARDDHTFSRSAPWSVPSMLAAAAGGGNPEPLHLGAWTLTVESWTPGPSGQPGDTARTRLGAVTVASGDDGTLPAWTSITREKGYPEDLADVSGIGTYTADITLGDVWHGVKSAYLDVGAVVDTVRVAVNGRDLPPVNQLDRRHIEVGPYLRPGRNTVSIRVASTLLNAVRVAPGTDASGRPRMDYGLIGPVTLTPRASRNPILTAEALQRLVPLARGGYNEVAVTVTNGSPRSCAVTIAASAAGGITAFPEPARVTLAGGESTVVTVKVRNAGLESGTSLLTVVAGVDNGPAATTTSTLAHSRNLAQNPYGTVLPRLYGSASQDFYPPFRAVDGKEDTFWVSRGRATGQGPTRERPVDFTVDFGDKVQVGTVSVSSGPQADYGPRDFDVDASGDGRNWTTVRSVTNAPRGTSTTTFPPVQARFLRLRITATLDPLRRNVQIAELVATP
ncbi:glycosyl hydrolase [Amycolatopsis sp. NBC_01480]|uniref:glycosyl hydrolase n=1 Tax=Amycolatopsis sp. NBC_01480 TaxID=2903562 RepID=UPI002E2E6ED6|nr:glycosyl hydrolase [Amycolatopsis sp. NBC_01480]